MEGGRYQFKQIFEFSGDLVQLGALFWPIIAHVPTDWLVAGHHVGFK